ncbi:hypothetical protein PPACK8108_LOCUS18641 [Phakopsora pachyrhizi]|uniref:Uncharacterized protein n=1 Tax=Phakopsora pachyrhizi TaxID=170000 RepID=A0AAV0BE74_PHAPC|nr:hypothetical protein PPACK8108_LOCUS18641 [Phakopsora pachyrhizi]
MFPDFSYLFDQPIPAEILVVEDLNKMGKSSRMMMEITSWKNKADTYKNEVKSSAVGLQGHG